MRLVGMIAGAALLCAGFVAAPVTAAETKHDAPVLLESGQHTQAWFVNSFLLLAEDMAEAAAAGKRFAVMWEQRGCPYCLETHKVNFADPAIQDYVRKRFNIVQLDIHGAREVTDVDGTVTSERELARKYGVRFTPTIVFFAETADRLEGKQGRAAEVARMTGYFRPPHFLAMFEWVHERAYEREPFQRYLDANAERLQAQAGKAP